MCGNTISCGTGACATAICAMKCMMVENRVNVNLEGGKLIVENNDKGIIMTGGAEIVFEGRIDL